MRTLLKPIIIFASLFLVASLTACTTASVEQDIATQQAVPQQETAVTTQDANLNQQAEPNALSAQTSQTPAQNVTQSQLQQENTIAQTQASQQEVASLDTSKAMTFLPFEGAPQAKTTSLSRLLNISAQSNGLTILPPTRTGAKYRIKGYFSALNDGNGTLLVYVWDVVDGSGKRLHRINGSERTNTTRTNPWQAITDDEMQRVASATTARLKKWVDKR